MHAAWSVIAFTVLSGAGLGALALVALAVLASTMGVPAIAPRPALGCVAAVALAFVVAGLGSSTLHLANPRNAWRSASRFRSSWLSREAVFALALLPVVAGFAWALYVDLRGAIVVLLALATLVLAWVVLVCTAMIYASLKPIRAWHTRRVPLGYVVLGHGSGALLLVALLRPASDAGWLPCAGIVLLLAALIVKVEYWRHIRGTTGAPTLERAIGVDQGVRPPGTAGSVMSARLLDAGHSGGTFLTREFLVRPTPAARIVARLAFLLAGIAVPVLWLAVGLADPVGGAFAVAACLAGMAGERWLFFVEARHTVRLYHGDATA